MPRLFVLAAVAAALVLPLSPDAGAATRCGTTTSSTCTTGTTAKKPPQKQTQKKSGLKQRTDYSATERERIMERARQICKKSFGQPSRVYRIDYAAGKVWCEPPSM